MISSILTPEVVTGLVSLAGGAFTGMIANQQKMLLTSMQHTLDVAKIGNEHSNAAAERAKHPASWLQRIVATIIILVSFGGLVYAASRTDINVSYIFEHTSSKFLGLFGGGEKVKVIEAQGFVIPPYVKYSVISVVNFLFGASVMKLRRV